MPMTATDTKTRLMDAAEHAVRHRGADGFSYADLSAQVGVRKASIHYHFPTKSDLLTAIMNRYAKRVLDALTAYSEELPSACEQAGACISLYRNALLEGTALCLCVAYSVSESVLSDETRDEVLQFRHDVLNWLETVFSSAEKDGSIQNISDPKAEAAALLALVEGAQIASRYSGRLEDYDLAVQNFQNRFIYESSS